MEPVNNKSLLHFLYNQMEKLDNKEIEIEQAKAMAELAKQANNILKYEIDRANVLMKLDTHNSTSNRDVKLRDVEGKLF
jgi:hypothetical protein